MLIPKRFPGVGWAFAVACLVAAVCIDLSRYHDRTNADTIIPILVSLYKWKWFYWGQDRLGMLLPTIALPFSHPFTNLLVQTGLSIFGGLAAIGLLARYLLRSPVWGVVGSGGAALFLVTFPAHDRFFVLNGAQPYLVPLALALSGILLACRRRWAGVMAGLALTAIAYWYNSGLALVIGPLVVGRFAVAWLTEPPASPVRIGAGLAERVWSNPALRECAIALALTGLGTVVGVVLIRPSARASTEFALVPANEWLFGWVELVYGLRLRYCYYLWVIGGMAAGGLVWFVIPCTRWAAARSWLVAGVLVGSLVVQVLVSGVLSWVKLNNYDIRYLYPGVVALAPAAVVVLVGPFLAAYSGLARRAGYAAAAAIPVAAVAVFGPPSVSTARAAVDGATGCWTADVLASGCTHAVGNYWEVWPAVFHANMTLADRAEARMVWGVTIRAEATAAVWSQIPPEESRLGWLISPGHTEPVSASAGCWRWAYPDVVPIEAYSTLVVFAERPVTRAAAPARERAASDWLGWPGQEARKRVKLLPAPAP